MTASYLLQHLRVAEKPIISSWDDQRWMQQSAVPELYLYLKREVTLGLRIQWIVFLEIKKLNFAETIAQTLVFLIDVQKRKLPARSLESTSSLNFLFDLRIISIRQLNYYLNSRWLNRPEKEPSIVKWLHSMLSN